MTVLSNRRLATRSGRLWRGSVGLLSLPERGNPTAVQWAYALGLPTVRGHSPTDLASRLGVSEAEFSAGVQRFLTRIPSAWADRPPVPSDKRRRHEGLRLGILKSSNRFYRPSPQARLANLLVARRGSP
jgi:hypothetical protein